MINSGIGDQVELDGRAYLKTRPGGVGHAVYGPYITLGRGRYLVEFTIRFADEKSLPRDADLLLGVADVVSRGGAVHASAFIFRSQLNDEGTYALPFELSERAENIEFRVMANGAPALLIGDDPLLCTSPNNPAPASKIKTPKILEQQPASVMSLFTSGIALSVAGEDLIATASGVSFFVRSQDDMNFVGEVLLNSTYNVLPPKNTVIIDIGMNIGFTSLLLAKKEKIVRIHAYEPFKSTFDRAAANISLNPQLKSKITINNFGLSDRNDTMTIHINSSDSGSYSVADSGGGAGEAVKIAIKDAAATLRPIIAEAKSRGEIVILKVDCEGSEFAIFKSMADHDLLKDVHGFMVEWHAAWGTASDLIAPLQRAGFVVFDLSPASGNGFFYAVRAAT